METPERRMKWPQTLTLVRHDTSAYNILKGRKAKDPLYQQFEKTYKKNPDSEEAYRLAIEIKDRYSLKMGDHNTPLAETADNQAQIMASNLRGMIGLPDIIFVSPYQRTQETLGRMLLGWPELSEIRVVEEERIREQDHGLALLYNDWKVFNVLHPEQRKLRNAEGPYWYRYPQGENIPDVRERLRSWLGTVTRDYSGKDVLAVTHHLAIISLRANLERLGAEKFEEIDNNDKPINAGITIYRGDSTQGKEGHLVLDVYNAKLY